MDPVQMMQEEIGLSEVTEYLQYLTRTNMAPQPGLLFLDQRAGPSLAPADQCVALSESTPGPYGEVPEFVLDRLRDEEDQAQECDIGGLRPRKRSRSRICLETKLKAVSAADEQGHRDDGPSGINLLKLFQPAGDDEEEVLAQPLRQVRTDGVNPGEGSSLDVSALCDQSGGIPHTAELNLHQDDVVAADGSNKRARQSSTEKGSSPYTTLIQRRERHNMMERERRKKIRMYCDQLNKLVPFCKSNTDRVSTLHLTTAFLAYIIKTYGSAIHKSFLQSLSDVKEL